MTGIWILILLVFISALPILPVFIWFRLSRFPLSLRWFLISLAAGCAALLLAGFLQTLFSPQFGIDMGSVFLKLFIHVALTEEAGRLALLLLVLQFRRLSEPLPQDSLSFGAAAGLLAGLGFAVIETAAYGAADPSAPLLRAVTAAPLHGACGCRVGLAAASLPQSPFRALAYFFNAVAVHGMYNFMTVSPGLPPVFSILLVFTALFSSIQVIRRSANTG
ncbi:MAG: PrsW family intramembrane metalloprotease [Treponema sp.]|jgi:RsiW-degrading membrane proteinase PrsW (M82 family)|nr:PrsW family intramembrane metalloprotease [Treponema sp.]